jgi:DNA polymerase III epsilon subunit-like protein
MKLAIVDFETTGLDEYRNEIIEGSILYLNDRDLIEGNFTEKDIEVKRALPIFPEYAFEKSKSGICAADINGFTVERWKDECFDIALTTQDRFLDWVDTLTENCLWIGANPQFDYRFYLATCNRYNHKPTRTKYLFDISLVGMMMQQRGRIKRFNLDTLAKFFLGESQGGVHSSKRDVYLTARIYREILLNVELSGLSRYEGV